MTDEIKIVEITENEDGSALVSLEMNPEVYAKIFNAGFINLIEEGLKKQDTRDKVQSYLGKEEW